MLKTKQNQHRNLKCIIYWRYHSYLHRKRTTKLCNTKTLYYRCNPRCCVVICEGMALIERVVQRSKQKKHTDLRPTPQATDGNTVTITGTGPDVDISAEPSDQLDFLFIDADSKDSSLGLSAPPKTFITASALHTLYEGMHPISFSLLSLLPLSVSPYIFFPFA